MLLEPKIRIRIAAVIIKNGKLLFVKGKGYKELWTVGGKVDGNETDEECLKRELKEEIGVNITDMKFYKEYKGLSFYDKVSLIERVYITSIKGDITPDAEIESFVWFSKDDFNKKTYLTTEEKLILDLIKDKVW